MWAPLFFLIAAPPAPADPGYLWLEPGPQMQRRGGGQGSGMGIREGTSGGAGHGTAASGNPHAPAGHAPAGQAPAASGPGSGHRPRAAEAPEEKRAAMSHPAHYTLRLGRPPDGDGAPDVLRHARAAIVRPDFSSDRLAPVEEAPGLFRIRDAALLRGRYEVTAAVAIREGDTLFRLYTQTRMRNAGHPLQEAPPADAKAPDIAPLLAIEDLSPDPGENFARIHRRHTGDDLPLRILLAGEPVKALPVTLTTASGWRRTLVTDDKGEVRFTLIKEHFHRPKTDKTPVPFFVTVELQRPADDAAEAGPRREVLRGALALIVHPTPLDWESRAAGFYTVVIVGTAVALGTAVRRRRRRTSACV